MNYSNRGWAYLKLEKYDEAESDFTQAIQKNYTYAYVGRAELYKAQGKTEQAVNDYVAAGKKYYNEQNNREEDNQEYSNAKTAFENALKLDADCDEAKFYLAVIAYDAEKIPHKAIEKYDELIKSKTSYKLEVVYHNRGKVYLYSLNEYEKAIADFTEAINIDPTYMNAYAQRAFTYFNKTHDYAKAFADYQEIFKLDEKQKVLSEEKRANYEKNSQICWNALNPIEKGKLIILYPDLIGEISGLLKAFIVIMIVDFILALAEKRRLGNLTFVSASKEFAQKALLLVIVFVINEIDEADLITLDLRNIVITLILLFELLLILDNAGNLGVPIPPDLKNLIEKIIEKVKKFFGLS